jgi:hypothetical protein
MKVAYVLAALAGVVATVGGEASAANLLINGSFETGTYTFGADQGTSLPPGSTQITGWTVITNTVAPLGAGNPYQITAQDGNVSLDMQGYGNAAPYGAVQQTIPTLAGLDYLLTFYVGVQNNVGSGMGPASVTATAGGTSQLFTNTNNTPGSGQQWQLMQLPFTATGPTTTIVLAGTSTFGGQYIGLDNASVELVTPIPEPAGLAILGAGAAALLVRRRRCGG